MELVGVSRFVNAELYAVWTKMRRAQVIPRLATQIRFFKPAETDALREGT